MKFLLVLLIAGFGLATVTSAFSSSFQDGVQLYDEHEAYNKAVFRSDDNEDANSLRKRLEELMEVLKKSRDNDEQPPRETLLEMKKIFGDMEKRNIELTAVEELVKWAVEYYLNNRVSTLYAQDLDDILLHEDPTTELGRILKKHFEEILEKVKDIIDNGKAYKEDLGEKLKEIAQKLKDMKVDIGDHAKDLLNKLKDKAKDYWKKILDKITPGSDTKALFALEDPTTQLGKILKKHFEEILEKVKDIIDNGKAYKEDLGEKLKEIAQKLKDMKVDIGDHAKDLLNKLKDKAKDYWKKILDKITPGSDNKVLFALDPEVKTELGKKLRGKFDEIRQKLRDIFENGKTYEEELLRKMKDIWQNLRNIGEDISEEAKEDIKNLKEKARDYWRKILDKIFPDKEASFSEGEDLARNLRERFEEILEKIKDAIENRKLVGGNVVAKFVKIMGFQLKEIYQQMKEKSIPFGDKAKELFQELKEKATGIWKRIFDKINISKRSVEARGTGAENLRERLEELLEKLKESFRDRKLPGKGFISKLREIREEMRQKKVPLGGKLKEMIENLKEKASGIWRRILDRLSQHAPQTESQADISDIIKMKEVLEDLIKKAKDAFDNGSTVTEYLERIQQIRDALKLLNIDLGEKAKEYLQVLKDKVKDYWRQLKEKLTSKRNADIDVFGMFEELKNLIREKFDLNKVKEYIKKVFGEGSEIREMLLTWLKDKGGKQKILDFIDRILGENEAQNSVGDWFHKVKDYFKELNIELHEKYAEFGHWLKEQYEDRLEKGKDKVESLKDIAREFLHDTRMMSKHIAAEAKFFFTEYGHEVGDMLGDVMKKIDKVLKS